MKRSAASIAKRCMLVCVWLALVPAGVWAQDSDADGVLDAQDNCTYVANAPPLDCDTDQDGYGNMCDGDFTQDCFVLQDDRILHFDPSIGAPGNGVDDGTGTDMDCNGVVNSNDYEKHWWIYFAGPGNPGPSGAAGQGGHCP